MTIRQLKNQLAQIPEMHDHLTVRLRVTLISHTQNTFTIPDRDIRSILVSVTEVEQQVPYYSIGLEISELPID